MAEFTAKWTDPSQINNGKTFVNIEEVSASDFNALVGNMLYLEQNGMEGNEDMGYFNTVGAIYMSTSSTSPASIFGGTWVRIKDRFLLGAGDSFSAGATGGESEHTLTVAEMPKHTHTVLYSRDESSSQWVEGYLYMPELADSTYSTNTSGTIDCRINVGTNGGSAAHNNMPPYLTIYIWHRTA